LIIDPLDGTEKKNPYKIVSYRLFSVPEIIKDLYPARPDEVEEPEHIFLAKPEIKEKTLFDIVLSFLF
jgi:hypothetical protein